MLTSLVRFARPSASLLAILLLAAFTTPSFARNLELANGVQMEVVTARGWFLGLGAIAVDDRLLRSGDTLVYPLLAADWHYPAGLYADLALRAIEEDGDARILVLDVYATDEAEAWERYFVFTSDGAIARDPFHLARTQIAADATGRETTRRPAGAPGPANAVGTLRWRIEPVSRTIAGWPWHGWEWSFHGELDEDQPPLNVFRLLGGWALDGHLDGLTLANQRYRGFGYPAQTLVTDDSGASTSAWSAQDLWNYLEPYDGHSARAPRDEALKLRNEAYIHTPARGAGIGFIDYQFRPAVGLVSFPVRQGNLRAVAEVYRGDTMTSLIDEDHFAATHSFQTVPRAYLLLDQSAAQPDPFWHTRYLEIDHAVRAQVTAELGWVETPVLPTIGALFDFWRHGDSFAAVVSRLGSHANRWAELGVRRIMVHNPGWENGRAARNAWDGATRDEYVGGSVNTVYDWWPLPHVESAWRDTHAALSELGIEYYVWLTGMVWHHAGFYDLVGPDPAHWASNAPDGSPSDTYGNETVQFNILAPAFRDAFDQRLDGVRRQFGYEGYWGDSFQNLWMSQYDWITRDGEPQQRAWWEWLAQRSRQGVGWISESQSFPGLSCSLETDQWDEHPWLLGHTIKWLRGRAQQARSPQGWRPLAYRLMAHNAWLAPETWLYEVVSETQPDTIIEAFGRLANEFLAARPFMDRPYLLSDGRGVLWLPFDRDNEGVLFPFKRWELPDGLTARPVLDPTRGPTGRAWAEQTVLVSGDDLRGALGITTPPGNDERTPLPMVTELTVDPVLTPDHPPVLHYTPVPGRHHPTTWNHSFPLWQTDPEASPQPWPAEGSFRAVFPPDRRVVLPVEGTINAQGVQARTPGIDLVIPTTADHRPSEQPGSRLELHGPLLGEVDVYFQGTLQDNFNPHTAARAEVGLQFRGGGTWDLAANLLPWLDQRHLHSPVVGLDDPGTRLYFRGHWEGNGELCRPGLVLGDETHFIVWPEASFDFIKDYGGFTLQLWVTGIGNEGGTLELHHDFVADRSHRFVRTASPHAADLRPSALGAIRLGGATLVTNHSQNLPLTGRALGNDEGGIQHNGHLVFEHRDTNRWIVQTRDQTYRGAVWVDRDLVIETRRDLILEGVNEPPDRYHNYTAANAFQTRRTRWGREGPLTIRKTGDASLHLAGDQAYVADSHLVVAAGALVLHTDPQAGGRFPKATPQETAELNLRVEAGAQLTFASDRARIRSLDTAANASLNWSLPTLVTATVPVTLDANLTAAFDATTPQTLLRAPAIQRQAPLPPGWTLTAYDDHATLSFQPSSDDS